ncbi:MAG TPA: hypothetical protein VK187_03400, partial [Geobacteraceae bacterium]|nr:hypothetical protein [Geobacteraceae bacterium]
RRPTTSSRRRPVEAVPVIEAAIKTADNLGDYFTLSDHPVCLACKGYAEMPSPIEADRKVRCQDTPSVCKGNKYGRMHPVQLLDYVKSLLPPEVPPIHDSVGGGEETDPPALPPGGQHVDSLTPGDDMKPTPVQP